MRDIKISSSATIKLRCMEIDYNAAMSVQRLAPYHRTLEKGTYSVK